LTHIFFVGGVSKQAHLFFPKSPDFLKPGLCHVLKFSYL